MSHEAPLRLRTGADSALELLPVLCAMTAVFLLLVAGLPWDIALPVCALCLLAGGLLTRYCATVPTVQLELRRDGVARWKSGHASWQHGHWSQPAWLNRRYAIVTANRHGAAHRFLVSRRRQAPGRFRKLSAWLRWPPAQEDG
ncbi:MAG: hypothetical protein HKN58_11290 [Xanthomonadales bacterium]|nr:hypothetical protein [Xanthomonadales bacterium]